MRYDTATSKIVRVGAVTGLLLLGLMLTVGATELHWISLATGRSG